MGCNLRQWFHSAWPLDTLSHQLELLLSLGWSNNYGSGSTLSLQLACESDNELVSKEGATLGNDGWHLNVHLWQFLGLLTTWYLY